MSKQIPVFFKCGLKENLKKTPIIEGNIYLTKDTCELFYDNENERKQWLPDLSCILYEIEEEIDDWEFQEGEEQ